MMRTDRGSPLGPSSTLVLALATAATGLTAGVFVHWSNTVMPGLRDVDDRSFVEAFRALNETIVNPLFIGLEFIGSFLLMCLATLLLLVARRTTALIWVGAAMLAYLAVFAITFGVNEPLNQEVAESGKLVTDADFAAVRNQLDEAKWTAWNTVRAVANTISFGCLIGAVASVGSHPRTLTETGTETGGGRPRQSW